MVTETGRTAYALVTGGSRGLGKAIAVALAARGYNLLITYQHQSPQAASTLSELLKMGVKAEGLQFDVRSQEATQECLGGWLKAHKEEKIEVLVNNAGIRQDQLLAWQTPESWHSVLDTTLDGFLHVTQLVLLRMLTHHYGRIVNVASMSGLEGVPGQTNYAAAKGGLIAATRALAMEVARKHITVNAVAPGFIESDMTLELPVSQISKQIPMHRFGRPEEVAAAVCFLASPEASYITGQTLAISGGI